VVIGQGSHAHEALDPDILHLCNFRRSNQLHRLLNVQTKLCFLTGDVNLQQAGDYPIAFLSLFVNFFQQPHAVYGVNQGYEGSYLFDFVSLKVANQMPGNIIRQLRFLIYQFLNPVLPKYLLAARIRLAQAFNRVVLGDGHQPGARRSQHVVQIRYVILNSHSIFIRRVRRRSDKNMAILGTLLKRGIKLRENLEQEYSSPFELQRNVLKDLLITARETEFGRFHNFPQILGEFRKGPKDFYLLFQKIPLHDYNKIYNDWWKLSLKGVKNICWPGRVKYFALSSGTSEASSKYIPVTKEMTRAIQRTSIRQILSLSKYDLPSKFFEAGILMIGGSTHLNKKGNYFEGDLSGIQAARLPFWFQHFYKPGKRIAKTRKWSTKLEEITRKANQWDIGIIVGVPAWIQILLEKVIAYHKLNHIHEIWPNLCVYVHGGVSFDPYRKGFEKLLGRPINFIETYLASEGFVAYQASPNNRSMKLVLNNGIFYEFVPFTDENFTGTGELKPDAKALLIDEVVEGKEYALLLSSCAGAWRYLIGDIIKFTSVHESEIIIAGRTKHFLSLCGEHLSVENMNKAIEMVSDEMDIDIKEFTVAGIPHGTLFAHHWFIGTDQKPDAALLRERLDHFLKTLNDDYAVERSAALKEVYVDLVPVQSFYDWMELKGKSGGQNKFPRVLKNAQLEEWKTYLAR